MFTHRFASVIALGLTASALGGPITVINGSFELPALAPNGFLAQSVPGTLAGWANLGPGPGGIFYPTVASWGYAAPAGNQLLFLNGTSFEQTLAATIVADRTYTLRIAVVNRPTFFTNNYAIQLRAGTTVVAQNLGTVTPPPGGSQDAVLVYTAPSSGPTIGQPIRIRLTGALQTNLDDVRLEDDAPAGCPGDVNGDGKTTVGDFNILAGHFATGPGATHAQGDLSGDGFVNATDFNILAGDLGCTS